MFYVFLFVSLSAFLAADTAAIEPQGSVVAVGAVLPQVDLSIILPIGKDFNSAGHGGIRRTLQSLLYKICYGYNGA
jgi:hypothetical protein